MTAPSPNLLRLAPELGPLHMLEHAIALLDNALDAAHPSIRSAPRNVDPRVALARSMAPLFVTLSLLAQEYRSMITDATNAPDDSPH